jgi:large subunit ribosomal protein L25
MPRDLPDVISVDVSELNVGDAIHVRDIQLPSGVTTRVSPDLTAISIMAPTVADEDATAGVAPTTAPEVIKEKKEDSDAAAGAKDKK